jgi:hypothetical protein
MKVITVRLPDSLHSALKEEAYQGRISLNQLCITKLTCDFAKSELEDACQLSGSSDTPTTTPTA